MTDFQSLGLSETLLKAVASEGYTSPTPVQEQSIPPLLDGRDVLGVAQTGTGKTAAFALPVLQIMGRKRPQGKRHIRALILSPTRELAAQIDERFAAYSEHMDIRHRVIFGGVKQNPQVRALQKGLDILVATPGRLLDLIGQGFVDITKVEFFVLDEADRMLDMGFIRDIEKVLKLLPNKRQNLLFSATMPKSIAKLAGSFLNNAVMVDVSPKEMTVDRIEQKIMFLRKADKRRLLVQLIKDERVKRGIVFTRTKHGANRLVKQLDQSNIAAAAIHGNKSQGARTRALAGFKDGSIPILVATDIASRGIDVDGITHVFNYDLPNEPESYVHRIGRTARAGRSGISYAFCDDSESGYLVGIQQLIGKEIPFHWSDSQTWAKAW
jgi:ATP-dependent RNA helicase RhlE